MLPETGFASVGESRVAYETLGEGGVDLIFLTGMQSHVDHRWGYPAYAAVLQRLATIGRLIFLDRRGAGASDPSPRDALPTVEEWADDIRAVLDAVRCERAALYALLDASFMGILFAAAHPDRVSSLVLANATARVRAASDYPHGMDDEQVESLFAAFSSAWGTEDAARFNWPSRADDESFRRWNAMYQRSSARPREAAAALRYMVDLDVRSALPAIKVPTLVIHRNDCVLVPAAHGKALAEGIAGARYVEVPGGDAGFGLAPGDDEVIDLIIEFVSGSKPALEADRVLATVLFTDIVASSEHAARMGDRRWREVLEAHDAAVQTVIERFRGRVVKSTGDGILATFDGPGRAIRASREIVDAVRPLGLNIRVGLHSGEVEMRDGGDISGLAVNIAARIADLAGAGEILCTRTVRDLVVGSGFGFGDRGEHVLKGIPDAWHLYAIA